MFLEATAALLASAAAENTGVHYQYRFSCNIGVIRLPGSSSEGDAFTKRAAALLKFSWISKELTPLILDDSFVNILYAVYVNQIFYAIYC
jgi:hypothetical protein